MSKLCIINANESPATLEGCKLIAKRMTALCKRLSIEIVHFSEATRARVKAAAPDAVIVGPQGTPWWGYPKEALARAHETVVDLGERGVPVLGICGGHQFLAMAHGGTVGPIGKLCETDGLPKTYAGLAKEKGPVELRASVGDPLSAGVELAKFEESHCEEVKRLPKNFVTIMTGGMSRVQAMRHRDQPVWGVQFHPERFWQKLPAGKHLLANFVTLAKL